MIVEFSLLLSSAHSVVTCEHKAFQKFYLVKPLLRPILKTNGNTSLFSANQVLSTTCSIVDNTNMTI